MNYIRMEWMPVKATDQKDSVNLATESQRKMTHCLPILATSPTTSALKAAESRGEHPH